MPLEAKAVSTGIISGLQDQGADTNPLPEDTDHFLYRISASPDGVKERGNRPPFLAGLRREGPETL